jgi:hypothetical protein
MALVLHGCAKYFYEAPTNCNHCAFEELISLSKKVSNTMCCILFLAFIFQIYFHPVKFVGLKEASVTDKIVKSSFALILLFKLKGRRTKQKNSLKCSALNNL